MGKTGSVQWAQVKGVKGQIRLVPSREGEVKKPGPNQRFKSSSSIHRSRGQEGQDSRGRGGSRGGSRGGRGGRGGRGATVDVRVRRRVQRSRVSIMGAKQKSR
jgi:hypothetical protein